MTPPPLLLLHIGAGSVGLLAGTAAVSVRKGSRLHGTTGIVFSCAMLTLGITGALLGYLRLQPGNILGGILTFYLVATAWRAGRAREPQAGLFDWAALLFALVAGAGSLTVAWRVAHHAMPSHGTPAGMSTFLGGVVLLAAAGDLRLLLRGGIAGRPRIARHLWRMCFGLFIASGSFFMGRQAIFPAFIQRSGILIVLTVFPLLLIPFWLRRIRQKKAYTRLRLVSPGSAALGAAPHGP